MGLFIVFVPFRGERKNALQPKTKSDQNCPEKVPQFSTRVREGPPERRGGRRGLLHHTGMDVRCDTRGDFGIRRIANAAWALEALVECNRNRKRDASTSGFSIPHSQTKEEPSRILPYLKYTSEKNSSISALESPHITHPFESEMDTKTTSGVTLQLSAGLFEVALWMVLLLWRMQFSHFAPGSWI